MEAKHTPGPWELDGPSAAHVTDEDYHNIRAGCGFWAEAKDQREPGFSLSGHMSTADARLIAAAPDLLEALIELEDQADLSLDYRPEFRRAIASAHSAIVKAIGSAQ
jgi:hypothetical protein